MGNLIDHARKELEIAGLFDEDSDYGGMIGEAVMKMIEAFEEEGHSGFSANWAVSLFEKLARYKPLTPLTGEDDEWNEVTDGHYQNRRCSHVFKENDKAYDSQGRIFRDENGATFTSRDSRVSITFPYVPKSEIIDVVNEPEDN